MVLLAIAPRQPKRDWAEFNRSFANEAFSLATLLTLLLVAVIFRGNGIYMMAWVAVFTTASKSYFNRRLGGVTGDTFGAVGELSETSVMVLLAL